MSPASAGATHSRSAAQKDDECTLTTVFRIGETVGMGEAGGIHTGATRRSASKIEIIESTDEKPPISTVPDLLPIGRCGG